MSIRILAVSLALLFSFAAHAQTPSTNAPAAAQSTETAQKPTPTALVVKFKVKPGQNAAFEAAFREMAAAVRDHEPGNVYYDLFLSDQPQTYVVLERYKDQAAVTAHGQSAHGQKLFAALRDVLDGPPEVQRLVLVVSK